MAKKQVDGDGLDIPNRIKALPVKRTGPIVAAIIVALFAAMLVQALVTNPRFEWNVVWKYLFDENVREGIKYTLLLPSSRWSSPSFWRSFWRSCANPSTRCCAA